MTVTSVQVLLARASAMAWTIQQIMWLAYNFPFFFFFFESVAHTRPGVGKLRPAGRMRAAKGIYAALQMLVNLEEKVANFWFDSALRF